jgi:hypothetical protein
MSKRMPQPATTMQTVCEERHWKIQAIYPEKIPQIERNTFSSLLLRCQLCLKPDDIKSHRMERMIEKINNMW